MNDSKIKETRKMYADIKTLVQSEKTHTFLTRKGKYNIGLFSVLTFF